MYYRELPERPPETTLNENQWLDAWRRAIRSHPGPGGAEDLRIQEPQPWGAIVWIQNQTDGLGIEHLVIAQPDSPVSSARRLAGRLAKGGEIVQLYGVPGWSVPRRWLSAILFGVFAFLCSIWGITNGFLTLPPEVGVVISATAGGGAFLGELGWGRHRARSARTLNLPATETFLVADIGAIIDRTPALAAAVLPELREALWYALENPGWFSERIESLHSAVTVAAPTFLPGNEIDQGHRPSTDEEAPQDETQLYLDGRLDALVDWLDGRPSDG